MRTTTTTTPRNRRKRFTPEKISINAHTNNAQKETMLNIFKA